MSPARAFFVRRVVISLIGLLIVMAGTSLLALSELGVSAATAIQFAMSLNTSLSFGTWVGIINMAYFVVQLVVLRKDFPVTGWFQVAAVIIASVAIDVWTAVLGWVNPGAYWQQLVVMFIGIVLIGFGTAIMVPTRTFFMPFEGMVQMFSDLWRIPFPRLKVYFDIVVVSIAALITVLTLDSFTTVREATLASALLVGPIIALFLPFARRLLGTAE